MDEFLAALGAQAMKYAIRSGIALTSSYAVGQCSRLLNSIGNPELHSKFKTQQQLLEGKLRIISLAFDLIELKSGRGNVFLDSALPLTRSLRQEIDNLGQRTEALAAYQESGDARGMRCNESVQTRQLQVLMADLGELIGRIDRETPLIQLAITASGETLSTSIPSSVSPSRLLQASTLLTVGDTHHSQYPNKATQIGPSFCLTLFMLFVGHAPTSGSGPAGLASLRVTEDTDAVEPSRTASYGLGEGERKPLWQEIIHKARVRLCRAPQRHPESVSGVGGRESQFEYYLEIIEDLEDGRVHSDTEDIPAIGGIAKAGIRENISIKQLSKLFYTDTGKLLNISQDTEGGNHPVLLLKRDSTPIPTESSAALGPEEVGGLEESKAAIESPTGSEDEQALIDQQLGAEQDDQEMSPRGNGLTFWHQHQLHTSFPQHLDPDWIAMEMFQMDACSSQDSELGSETEDDDAAREERLIRGKTTSGRPSVDSQLETQIRGLSLRSTASPMKVSALDRADMVDESSAESTDYVERSPFGAITTSLSLLEMLIRLASLQEFQQAPHLSIPDHILSFFLEQTSSTGLAGDAETRLRDEVRRKVGFDPYSDKPSETEK